jgi:type III pantothenate kinase
VARIPQRISAFGGRKVLIFALLCSVLVPTVRIFPKKAQSVHYLTAIDIGNTLIKWANFDSQGRILAKQSAPDESSLAAWVAERKPPRLVIASVRKPHADLTSCLHQLSTPVYWLRSDSALPITHGYSSPQSLGLDRLAGVLGANWLFAAQNTLVIDAGTCITYDFINAQSHYEGGSISLGLSMRFRALHEFTARLPFVSLDTEKSAWIGTDTVSSISSGVVEGLLGEIAGFIQQYSQKKQVQQVVFCGGDGAFFEKRLKKSIFAPSFAANLCLSTCNDLVLYGLYHYARYQSQGSC